MKLNLKMPLRSLPIFGALSFLVPVVSPVAAVADTVVVTTASPNGWAFDIRDASGVVISPTTGSYVNGPSTPPLGTGSANLNVGNGTVGGDGGSELRNVHYAGTLVSSLTALGYSTFDTKNNGQQFPFLAINIMTASGSDKLWFEPPYQTTPTVLNTWQTWNALTGNWYDDNGTLGSGPGDKTVSFAALLAALPGATIVNPDGLGGIRLGVGFASPDNQFNGNVDGFTIGTDTGITTFDFEAAVPEPSTWAMMVLGFVGLGFMAYRRKHNGGSLSVA